jgi:hypothetical protein
MAALIFSSLLAIPVSASAQQAPDRDTNRAELATFDQFLDSHQQVSNELRKNPSLVNDPEYVRRHPELNEFFAAHPRVREEVKENPGAFAARERAYQRSEGNEARDRNDRDRDNNRMERNERNRDDHDKADRDRDRKVHPDKTSEHPRQDNDKDRH